MRKGLRFRLRSFEFRRCGKVDKKNRRSLSAKIEMLINNPVIFSFYRTVASSVLGVLLTMRIHLRYRKGLFSIGLIVLLLILWQFLWYRWATLW